MCCGSRLFCCRFAPPPPDIGVLRIPQHDFPQQFSDFSFHSHLTRFEVINAIQRVLTECQRVVKGVLVNATVSKSARLDEFEHGQNSAIAAFATMLKDTWAIAIKNHIKSSLKDVGKGWFNMKDTNRELYDFSKLKRLLTMVNFMMQASVWSACVALVALFL
jgi:dynein heavy chain